MGRREDSIAARRAARRARAGGGLSARPKDDRCSELGLTVVMALRERDSWVQGCEQRAGTALLRLVEAEGLSVRDAGGWCVGADTASEMAGRAGWRRSSRKKHRFRRRGDGTRC
jgi:hypothetical protein